MTKYKDFLDKSPQFATPNQLILQINRPYKNRQKEHIQWDENNRPRR